MSPTPTFASLAYSLWRVAEILKEAERAGGTIVKPAQKSPWGGWAGVFADPDGLTWKVASGGGGGSFHAE